ncbi:MAG: 50S ribosomal protein L17 [Candidatus Gottesmanbacteria bacterium GW2011_GWB1_43_11]|uniref:50S ribosomal protein L17 n=1 Tax=Candidatus Gottesmanbacteria bacterium GW2011_GWB1_43_11 TaxID=1618446 RepID=A0A0G1EUY9_9BACT|nr:MAG: 50S ribosomal protein L17 [Candidatus Gottesmanbacteria bacterium GW2011_GWA2_42_16]KKS55763.1 MAG: 50S ribosomal protein L17 [Candidatus Gottesmanbacteria bacterium GW2011_GWA1_42_26]KKS81931.1 MAG: hypothetical protein UV55_C0007G0052 [Candidatus Gottesmanbacteria bacterium GW2011_GWC1_43_10]KKS86851.1 MAG: 50S ribosomal protein L17 [Candidatus Gottesmanbacteria bacterium GW2011_GWB1_43_11]OGG10495.1 MAG: 50S ribosomal protein L17 [Candidatus Gottesmanbacteria bacterium RIFCSPHIGHO2_0
MKKGIKTRKLGRTTNERKQLFRNLTRSLVMQGFIVTTLAKARAIKPLVEKLVTRAKNNKLSNLRELLTETGDLKIVQGLFEVGKVMIKRPGGYTRLLRLAPQIGNNAPTARLEWVEKIVTAEVVTKPEVTMTKTVEKKELAVQKATSPKKRTVSSKPKV